MKKKYDENCSILVSFRNEKKNLASFQTLQNFMETLEIAAGLKDDCMFDCLQR